MTVKVKINDKIQVDIKPTVKVKITPSNMVELQRSLALREAINGDYMIFGHSDIDIIILKEQSKIVAFAKDLMTQSVYGAESRLFEFLKKRGVVAYDSIQGGNIYGSLEGKMLDGAKKQKNNLVEALKALGDWMKSEEPYIKSTETYDDMMDDYLLDPDDQETTELGEIPHEERKGSLMQRNLFAPYLYGRYTY